MPCSAERVRVEGAYLSIAATAFFDNPADVTFGFGTGDRLSLVVELLASGKGQLDLDLAPPQVDREGDQRIPAFPDAAHQFENLPAVEQELAYP
jgi:hypothetical protein